MEQEERKSPVDIVQKLIAVHTTRKETAEKMLKNDASVDLKDKLSMALQQSNHFIKELLNELSQFGDAVQSEVNREDEYHEAWKKVFVGIDGAGASALSDHYTQLESRLINIYTQITETYQDLPVSLNELLITQLKKIKQL